MQERVRMEKIHKNDRMIYKLRKMLKGVRVFRTKKDIDKRRKRKALLMLMYEPEKLAEVQQSINKRNKKKNGKSLASLIKKAKKKAANPFKGIVDVQAVIDDTMVSKKKDVADDTEDIDAMLKDEGMNEADVDTDVI